ncbi:hypothetical protein [Asanoa siamensis]|uniref:hypothetical protein n=1 Tax=Asanoa siamensis TaxID=926357 RepID=UPI0019424CB9|nr:hypothetical protein [Asanoa siamensis]
MEQATPDEIAEFAAAADEFLAQTAGYPAGPAAALPGLVGEYRFDLSMAGRGPTWARGVAASADLVRTRYGIFRVAANCGSP